MKVVAVNGSPRRKWNTSELLENALAGAKSQGADIELVHLYAHNYKGCLSCFECKKIGGSSYGRCAIKDDARTIIDKITESDVLILGSPIYFGTETGEMRSFLERLLFPWLTYTPAYTSIFPGKTQVGMIYSMNIPEQYMEKYNYDKSLMVTPDYLKKIFGNCEVMLCTDTYQFNDYSKYESSLWDADAKRKRHEEVFPLDCQQAFALGEKLCSLSQKVQE